MFEIQDGKGTASEARPPGQLDGAGDSTDIALSPARVPVLR